MEGIDGMSTNLFDRNQDGPSVRRSIPIVEQIAVDLDEHERIRLSRIAAKLLADEPALCSTSPFGPNVAAGLGPWPALVLEDHSAIALFDPDGDVAYACRALLLAGQGDTLAVSVGKNPAFERYCREWLGLGKVDALVPRATNRQRSLAARCASDPDFVGHLADLVPGPTKGLTSCPTWVRVGSGP